MNSMNQTDDAPPVVSEERKALVRELTTRVKDAKKFWEPQFERIREDIRFAGGDQWQDAEEKMADAASDKFQVNFVQRELNQQVSAIYAKNPTVTCERRKRLEYEAWDGDETTLLGAQQVVAQNMELLTAHAEAKKVVEAHDSVMTGGMPPVWEPPEVMAGRAILANGLPPEVAQSQAVVRDYMAGVARKAMYDRIAETAELVFGRQLDTQEPDFETQMKDLILREKTTGAGFVSVKFQRVNESLPTVSATHADMVDRLARLRAMLEEGGEDELTPAQKESIAIETGAIQKSLAAGVKPRTEGLVFDFRPTTSIVVDPKCRSLFKFLGARWVAEEYMLTPEAIQEQWGVEVKQSAQSYQHGVEVANTTNLNTKAGGANDRDNVVSGNWPDKATACVWIIYDKLAQLKYVVCDGHEDFLEEPEAPWPCVSGFWPVVALKLNRLEIEENNPKAGLTIYGQSAVRLMKPMQEEMNRTQEALREHRIASRPGYMCGKDTFDKNDASALSNRAPHDVVPLNNIPPGGDVSKVLVPIPTVPIDPALYRTDGLMQQVLLVTGMQQANMGTQGADEKATGQAIAEQSRITGVSSEVDSLDKFLTELARIGGEMLFAEMSLETVKQIAGPGAVWPNDPNNRQEIGETLYLDVEAGSMGRPNRAMEISNLQQMLPQLIQLAQLKGLPLDPLVKYAAKVLEFDFDIEEWLASAAPGTALMAGAGGAAPAPGTVAGGPANPAAEPKAPGAGLVGAMLTKAQHAT